MTLMMSAHLCFEGITDLLKSTNSLYIELHRIGGGSEIFKCCGK